MTNLISLSNKKKIHFIGIGGISMSGLAEIVHNRGFNVTGSDMKCSNTTKHLESLNIPIYYGHAASNIENDVDLIVYTAAIHDTNPEIVEAKAKNIELVTRSQFLGLIMKDYDFPICVSGTHGKTTTTSMLAHGLLAANLDPTISVGGILKAINGNIRIGHTKYFLTEACEYCNSFLDFFPKVGIILNIEEDHLDFFKDINDIRTSFQNFASLIPADGFLAINGVTPNLDEFTKPLSCIVETFGFDKHFNWYATNIQYDNKACASFDVYYNDTFMIKLKLHVTGDHNILNALSVCSVFNFLGLDLNLLNEGVKEFTGANQRFEIKGSFNHITVVDDYAHHPTEINATLDVAGRYPHKHLYVVFQPHTYTRTKAFLKDFAKVLQKAENIIITDIYAAREKDPGDISSNDIVKLIEESGKSALYMKEFTDIADYLKAHATEGDLIITMGAGNVNQIADLLLNK